MPISDHFSRVSKRRVIITTVDPSQRLVYATDKSGLGVQIFVNDIPPSFTWPQENEEWSIYEENGYWRLGYKFLNPDESAVLQSLSPGDTYPPPAGGGGPDTDPPATTTDLGLVELTVAPTDPAHPKVVTDEDPRNSNARTPTAHTHPESDIAGLTTDLNAKEVKANKGVANGYAPLDSGLLVPVANLPVATTGNQGIIKVGTGATDAMAGNKTLDQISAAADVNLGGHQATNAADPTTAQALATKQYVDNIGSIAQTPATGVKANKTANQTVANGIVTWNTEDFDTDGFHDNAVNPSRFTVPPGKAGKYSIHATVSLASGATAGTRNFSIIKNGAGTHIEAAIAYNSYDSTRQVISGILDLADGDYVEVNLYTAGVSVTVEWQFSSFSMVRVPGNNAVVVGPQVPALGAKVTHSVNQSFTTGGATNLVAFDTVVRDDNSMWVSGSNTRLTAKTAGWYQIHTSLYMGQGSVTAFRQVSLRKNGSTFLQTSLQDNTTAAYDTEQEVSCLEYLNAGDYVEVVCFFSGSTLTISALASGRSPQFSMVRVPGSQGAALGVTSVLPTNPVDGQECYYLADATNGIVWHLKYRAASASAYKWEYVGGSALFVKGAGATGLAASAGFIAWTGRPFPDPVLPLAGDYQLEHGSRMWVGNPSGSNTQLQLFAGATALAGTMMDHWQGSAGAVTTLWAGDHAQADRLNGAAAGTVIQSRYTCPAGSTTNFERPWIKVKPIRVG